MSSPIDKKNYTIPVWLLTIVIGVQIFLWLLLFSVLQGNPILNLAPPARKMLFIYQEQFRFQAILLLILIIESILWWRIRKKQYTKVLAWGYILPLIAAIVVLPLEALINHEVYLFLWKSNLFLFASLVILAHAFFIRALQQAYAVRKNRAQASSSFDISDIIDEVDHLT